MQILTFLLGGIGKVLRWLLGLARDYPWQSAVIVLVGALVLLMRQWGIDHRDLTDQLADANGTIAEERAAHDQTVENIMKGREAARKLDEQNAARVAAEAAAINERLTHELETRTRTYAARADRLRARLAALEAGDGGGGNAAVPGDTDATCRALGAADCADLVTRMTDAQASIDRLVALQAWARDVSAIEVNGGEEPSEVSHPS
ncbi:MULTISPECIES: hypothetical protein [Sphingomonadales]|uniref:hypothetical protein n=1 Tax=Sphingomonadales TaxID=204457 RepID=UPI000826F069|nr:MULTISPECIES: hypothetical protein [Sphingomonadales]